MTDQTTESAEPHVTVQHRCPRIEHHLSGEPVPCSDCYSLRVTSERIPFQPVRPRISTASASEHRLIGSMCSCGGWLAQCGNDVQGQWLDHVRSVTGSPGGGALMAAAASTLFEHDTYVLDVTWDRPGLPSLVGPFPHREEAEAWAGLNVPNGSWEVRPLAWPCYRPARVSVPSGTQGGGDRG